MFFGGSNNRNSNNHPKLKMTYFDARGRGELSRFILAYAGRDFEDNRIQFSEWPALKSSKLYYFFFICYNGALVI